VSSGVVTASLGQQLFEVLRSRIVNLQYGPGERIDPALVAAEFGASRAPVREALIRLCQRGLVVTKPRVGFFVREFTMKDIKDLCDMRELLELYALQESFLRIVGTPELENLKVKFAELADSEPVEQSEFDFLDHQLHYELIVNKADNSILRMFYSTIYDLVRMTAHLNLDRKLEASREHLKIVESIASKNKAMALQALRAHLRSVRSEVMAALNERGEAKS